ncbi:hypothetical protein [Kitasatospora cineracea]|uniref:hypothetical protein n=1 Tax=Kitasatospora cineracea TaxID=88074 RepID=UPI00382162BD
MAHFSSRGGRLVGTPVVRRGAHWWLTSGAGSLLATDPVFTGELDRFAAARAAAEREIAQLTPKCRRWWS